MSDWPGFFLFLVFMLIVSIIILQLAPFDPTKKKKKKKVVIQEPSDEVDNLAEKTESLTGVFSIYKKEALVH
jgi:hypothetical protein